MELGKKFGDLLNNSRQKKSDKKPANTGLKKTHLQAYIYSLILKILKEYVQNPQITFEFSDQLDIKILLKEKFEAINFQMQKEEAEEKIQKLLKEKGQNFEKINIKIRL